ncbi:MAG: Xaa-Pro peptidase family protein [Actinomycetota bacterium]|nr:Xaa-Pro peptidase family protein [Actinomycetota bacterium]
MTDRNLFEILSEKGVEKELAFPAEEYHRRVGNVQQRMTGEGIDVLCCFNIASSCYLTGYDSHMAPTYQVTVVPDQGSPVFTCAELEAPVVNIHAVTEDVRVFDWTKASDTATWLGDLLLEMGHADSKIALELSNGENFGGGRACDAATYIRLKEMLPGAELVDGTRLVLEERLIKTSQELDYMREAGKVTGAALKASMDACHEGVNENDIAAAAYMGGVSAGSELMSIDPMLMTGARTGLAPHIPYRRHVVNAGEIVYIELTGTYWRYNAPSMRSAVIGQPDDRQQGLADANLEVLQTLIDEARPGRTGDDVAKIAAKVWDKVPGVWFHGGYGYSIGMALQPSWTEQAVYIAEGAERELEPGMCFHLPVISMYPGDFGIGFSESIVITDDGCEVLTPSKDRELVVR